MFSNTIVTEIFVQFLVVYNFRQNQFISPLSVFLKPQSVNDTVSDSELAFIGNRYLKAGSRSFCFKRIQ